MYINHPFIYSIIRASMNERESEHAPLVLFSGQFLNPEQ
uniref:Venom protein n=1 Tax=Ampulex compressa TaxID=860918 RepID=A0A1W6EWB3_AMPCP|nr:venom protein [Ampulex compressa]